MSKVILGEKKINKIFINFINSTIIDYSLYLQESQGRDFKHLSSCDIISIGKKKKEKNSRMLNHD